VEDREFREFERRVFSVVEEESAAAVADGVASLDRGSDPGGDYVRIVPANPEAAELTVYAEFVTVAFGVEGHTSELLGGSEAKALHDLRLAIRAVIAGGYQWRYRQVTRRILFWRVGPCTQLVGRLDTEEDPIEFTRIGIPPKPSTGWKSYEPYRVAPR
jgi:hypothetical protein